MHPVNNNYFHYTDTAINSLEVDSLVTRIIGSIQYHIYTTLYIKIGHLDIFLLHTVHKNGLFGNRKAKHIGGPSGKVSRIRGNTPRSGDITCMVKTNSKHFVPCRNQMF